MLLNWIFGCNTDKVVLTSRWRQDHNHIQLLYRSTCGWLTAPFLQKQKRNCWFGKTFGGKASATNQGVTVLLLSYSDLCNFLYKYTYWPVQRWENKKIQNKQTKITTNCAHISSSLQSDSPYYTQDARWRWTKQVIHEHLSTLSEITILSILFKPRTSNVFSHIGKWDPLWCPKLIFIP